MLLPGSYGSGMLCIVNGTMFLLVIMFINVDLNPCRYSTFLLLYPTGISSEVGLIYIALPFIKVICYFNLKCNGQGIPFCMSMMNP